MNIHTLKYRMTRDYITHARYRGGYIESLPVCQLSAPRVQELAEIEEKLPIALQIVDRLRFMAKIDRSKYVPHQGARERARRAQ